MIRRRVPHRRPRLPASLPPPLRACLGIGIGWLAGCGDSDLPAKPPAAPAASGPATSTATPPPAVAPAAAPTGDARPAAAGYVEEDVKDAGAIEGTVTFGGDAPEPAVKDVPADKQPDCGAHYAVEELVVDKASRGLRYAVVYIERIDHGKRKPSEPVVLDQATCVFQPHVIAVPTGAKVEFRNGDKASHNVNVKAIKNKNFNKQIAAGGTPVPWAAEAPEVVPVVCDIHPWMKSWIVVKDHPYAAVTGTKGEFRLEGVPPGEYALKAWHEKLGAQPKEGVKVKVEAGATARAGFPPLQAR